MSRHRNWTIHRELRLNAHLARHHQAADTRELAKLGYGPMDIGRLLKRGRLVPAHRGVYHCGSVALEGDTALRCALLAAGPRSALTGPTAAHALGLLTFEPSVIHTVIEGDPGRMRRRNLRIRRVASLPSSDLLRVRGLTSTTPARTLLEFAGSIGSTRTNRRFITDLRALRRALREATVLDHELPRNLEKRVADRRGQRGTAILRGLLQEHLASSLVLRSGFETEFFEWCAELGLPPFETNAMVEGYEADVLWREPKVIVELDTFRYHGDHRAFEGNRERDTRLQAAGYVVLRFTDTRFRSDRSGLLVDLRTALAARGRRVAVSRLQELENSQSTGGPRNSQSTGGPRNSHSRAGPRNSQSTRHPGCRSSPPAPRSIHPTTTKSRERRIATRPALRHEDAAVEPGRVSSTRPN